MNNEVATLSIEDLKINKFQCKNAVIEFANKKKFYTDELVTAMPIQNKDGEFSEIWIKTNPKKIYVLNLSDYKKEYCIQVGKYFGDSDILFYDIYTGMVYKYENGMICLSLDSHDIRLLNANCLLYKPKYEL